MKSSLTASQQALPTYHGESETSGSYLSSENPLPDDTGESSDSNGSSQSSGSSAEAPCEWFAWLPCTPTVAGGGGGVAEGIKYSGPTAPLGGSCDLPPVGSVVLFADKTYIGTNAVLGHQCMRVTHHQEGYPLKAYPKGRKGWWKQETNCPTCTSTNASHTSGQTSHPSKPGIPGGASASGKPFILQNTINGYPIGGGTGGIRFVMQPGTSAALSIGVTGMTGMTTSWQKGSSHTAAAIQLANLHAWTSIPGANSNTLTITNFQQANAGYYQAVITNAAGTTLSNPVGLFLASSHSCFTLERCSELGLCKPSFRFSKPSKTRVPSKFLCEPCDVKDKIVTVSSSSSTVPGFDAYQGWIIDYEPGFERWLYAPHNKEVCCGPVKEAWRPWVTYDKCDVVSSWITPSSSRESSVSASLKPCEHCNVNCTTLPNGRAANGNTWVVGDASKFEYATTLVARSNADCTLANSNNIWTIASIDFPANTITTVDNPNSPWGMNNLMCVCASNFSSPSGSPSPTPSASPTSKKIYNTNLLLGRAKHNFNIIYDLLLNSLRGPDCVPCSSLSSSSTSPQVRGPSSSSSIDSVSSSSSLSPKRITPPSSSSSDSPVSSSSESGKSSSSASLLPFNTYEIHPCGHYCPQNCNQWTDINGSGIDIKVPRIKDQGGLIKCYQPWYANSSVMITLYYKFVYVNFPAGSTYNDGCYLALKKKCDGPNIPVLLPSLNKRYSDCFECLSSHPSSSSSPSALPPTATQHEYEMYTCGTWTSVLCNQFYTFTGGTRIRVPAVRDVANTICPQNNGTNLEYKITTVKYTANSSPICALLIEKYGLTSLTNVYSTQGLFNNCQTCAPVPPPPSPSSSSSLSSSGSPSASPSVSLKPVDKSSSVVRCYTAKSSHSATSINEPGAGAQWKTYWDECRCCPPCCGASASWSANKQYYGNNTVRTALPNFNYGAQNLTVYKAFKCGKQEVGYFDGAAECQNLYRKASAAGQGTLVAVKTNHDLPNYTCAQVNGTTNKWKVCEVNWQPGGGLGNGCFLFVVESGWGASTPAPLTTAPLTAAPLVAVDAPVIDFENTSHTTGSGYCCYPYTGTSLECKQDNWMACTALGGTWHTTEALCWASCGGSGGTVDKASSSSSSSDSRGGTSSSIASIGPATSGTSSSSTSSLAASSSSSSLAAVGACCYWTGPNAAQTCEQITLNDCTALGGAFVQGGNCATSNPCIQAVTTSSLKGPFDRCTSCSGSPSVSPSASPFPKPSALPTEICPLFHVDNEDVKGPWLGRDPDYNRNLTITQGDTVCYRVAVYNHGTPVDIRDKDLRSYIKLRFSDYSHVEQLNAALVPGTNNIIELSLTAQKTTCLPVTELVYSCEIIDGSEIQNVMQGYLRVLPEVTRDASACTMRFTPTSPTSSSSSSSAKPTCCPKYYVKRATLGVSQYIFTIEVPTEEIVYKNISHWEVELTTNPGQQNSFNEAEVVQNEINPNNVSFGYDMIYPVGNGRYRFISKQAYNTFGTLVSVFSAPIPVATYNNAHVKLRSIADNGCITEWCEKTIPSNTNLGIQELFADCCPSSSVVAGESSSSSSSLSSLPGVPPVEQVSSPSSLSSLQSSASSSLAAGVAACCLPNGQCIHVTANQQGQAICAAYGGTYVAGQTCATAACTSSSASASPSAADDMAVCCLPLTAPGTGATGLPSCHAVPNNWQGWWECVINHAGDYWPGFTCADSICSSPGGGTPYYPSSSSSLLVSSSSGVSRSSSSATLSGASSSSSSATLSGASSSSSSATPVSDNEAACCLPNGACVKVENTNFGKFVCMLMGGAYSANTKCTASPCQVVIGSATCCTSGSCTNMADNFFSHVVCTTQGGVFLPNTTCETHPCYVSSSNSQPTTSSSSGSAVAAPQTFTFSVLTTTGSYIISGTDRLGAVAGTDPTIQINRGDTIKFSINAIGHPFWIKTQQTTGTAGAIAYDPVTQQGVSNNGAEITLFSDVTWANAGYNLGIGTYYYNCEHHATMTGQIIIS